MYDIIFMSYEESNADKHWDIVKKKFMGKKKSGVLGLFMHTQVVQEWLLQKCIML